jgi:hypothetical protein
MNQGASDGMTFVSCNAVMAICAHGLTFCMSLAPLISGILFNSLSVCAGSERWVIPTPILDEYKYCEDLQTGSNPSSSIQTGVVLLP